jgi:P pilus assembly chaperone PapD
MIAMLILVSSNLHAATTLDRTRVIYNENDKSRVLNVKNQGDTESLIKMWIDNGDGKSTPDQASQFIIQPPLYKIPANATQVVRIINLTKDFPKDRESVFYINALEMPAVDEALKEQNKLVLLTKSRIKLFYRPNGLKAIDTEELIASLNMSLKRSNNNTSVVINNPTPYHVSIFNGNILVNGRGYKVPVDMIAPFSTKEWPVVGYSIKDHKNEAALSFILVNDFGGYVNVKKMINDNSMGQK